MEGTVSFENFIFDSSSGELIRATAKTEEKPIRLSPQSSKLLQLLITSYPNLVSKEEIKSLLWPDVEVDFDNSLHFCIRQIRVALQDEVSSPKYIETIPRRGYRWLIEVKQNKNKKSRVILFIGIVAIILAAIGAVYVISKNNEKLEMPTVQDQKSTRLIIMPIEPSDSLNLFHGNNIAYDLLVKFGKMKELEVVGPTTTQNISQEELYPFLENSNSDFLINGKFSGSKVESSLLIEIIRTSDKAHVWVESFDYGVSLDSITMEIFGALNAQLKETDQTRN